MDLSPQIRTPFTLYTMDQTHLMGITPRIMSIPRQSIRLMGNAINVQEPLICGL